MNYPEELAHKLVNKGHVGLEMTEKETIAVIIDHAKKEIDPKTIKYWLLMDDDFLSDAVSTVNQLLKSVRACVRCTRQETSKYPMRAYKWDFFCPECYGLFINSIRPIKL